jgi:hypothetical protein
MYVQSVSARYVKDDPSIHPGHMHLHPHQQEISHASPPSPLEQTLLASQSPLGPGPSCRSGQSPQSADGPCMALSHRRSRSLPVLAVIEKECKALHSFSTATGKRIYTDGLPWQLSCHQAYYAPLSTIYWYLEVPVIPENPKQLPFLTFLSYDCTLDQYMSNPAGALWEVSSCDLSFLLYAPLWPRSSNHAGPCS